MSAETPRIPPIDLHVGPTDTGWWIWLLRCRPVGQNGVGVIGVNWGWDEDVPWSWLPAVHQKHEAVRHPNGEVSFHAHVWWSWLGFTLGGASKSLWRFSGAQEQEVSSE